MTAIVKLRGGVVKTFHNVDTIQYTPNGSLLIVYADGDKWDRQLFPENMWNAIDVVKGDIKDE